MEIIKEAYLPYIILMAAIVLILIFIIGALIRNNNQKENTPESEPSISAFCDAWTL